MTLSQRLGAWALIAAAAIVAVWQTATGIQRAPLPRMHDCLIGEELSLHAASLRGESSPAATFLLSDEAGYLRAARKAARGEVVNDFLADFILAANAAPADAELARLSPLYRTARRLGERLPMHEPLLVAYRSAVFPWLAAAVIAQRGCDDGALQRARWLMLPFRALLVIAAASLALQLVPRWKLLAAVGVAWVVALDAQANTAAATFMPDVPGSALFLLALCGLLAVKPRTSFAAAAALGGLLALAALVKFDFLYVAPLAVVLHAAAAPAGSRTAISVRLGVAVLVFCAGIGLQMARNAHHTGDWFVTSKDSVNLYLGNAPTAGASDFRYAIGTGEWAVIEAIADRPLEDLRSRALENSLRVHMREAALASLRAQPSRWAANTLTKAGLFVSSDGVRHFPALGAASALLSTAVMGLALVASIRLVLLRRGRHHAAPIGIALLASFALVSLVLFEPRYLSHLFALAAVLTAVTLAEGAGALLARRNTAHS